MSRNPFHTLHRAGEMAGYPALLLVSTLSLGIMVAAIALLAMTQAAWAFAVAMLSLFLAIAIVSAGIEAALADAQDPPDGQAVTRATAPDHQAVVPLSRRHRQQPRSDRKAA